MKTNFLKYCFSLLFSLTIFFHVGADQVWVGGSTTDVFDENLFIDGGSGDVLLPTGHRYIAALSVNVTVTLANNPVVRGNAAGESQLIVYANPGLTVNFLLENDDLTFKGSQAPSFATLLLYVYGGGTVKFIQNGGQTVTVTSDVGTSGPVWFYTETAAQGNPPTVVQFSRQTPDSFPNSDVNIVVGPQSLMGFTSQFPAGVTDALATIQFDGTNSAGSSGRMVLNIDPTGAFLVYPVVISYFEPFVPLSTSAISRQVISGGIATASIINNSLDNDVASSLQVVNSNDRLFDLLNDPFCTLGTKDDVPNYIGSYSGIQYGFVVSSNGVLDIANNTFLDYVGTTSNFCPVPLSTSCDGAVSACATSGCDVACTGTLVKERNPSALFIDGSYNPFTVTAQIFIGQNSALFFRSGGDKFGVVQNPNQPFQFTIDPADQTGCAGAIVFDVEGIVRIKGSNTNDTSYSKIELLSRDVYPYGGPLFYNTDQILFPIRSFTVDGDGLPRQYNKACFLINNRMNMCHTTLVHTDLNHLVVSKNDVVSEPTYIGGERPRLCGGERPKMIFFGSQLYMHESAAFTGVDLFVPNRVAASSQYEAIVGLPNISRFVFFSNGWKLDNGTGRQMILGTLPGSLACDGCTIVSNDAHLDVFQDMGFSVALSGDTCDAAAEPVCTIEDLTQSVVGCNVVDPLTLDHKLFLDVSANTTVINDQVPAYPTSIADQFSVQTIYLGNASNISVGTNADSTGFFLDTLPMLTIEGNFFSFETRGGPQGTPSSSQVTGKGGIFVDLNGTFGIDPAYRANMATMVTRSRNGIVNLPKNQVLYHNRVGLGNWKLDLNNISEIEIIKAGEHYSDYSLNWIDTTKDFDVFNPYVVDSVNSCTCPPVVNANISGIPTVLGRVEQLQILGSRLGDEAYVKIGQGGFVRELVYLNGCVSGEETVGFVVLEDDSRVGIGSAHRNIDSLSASLRLGINGVSIIGNGSGEIVLNEDVEIDNVCSILQGPDFAVTDTLRFTSEDPRLITVKKTGVLDLRSFEPNRTVEFGGQITIVLEPGARVHANGGIIRLADKARMVVQTVERAQDIFTTNTSSSVTITDDFRVKLIGTGILELDECSAFFIETDGFMGVETLYEYTGTETCEINVTDFTLRVRGDAQFIIGTDCEEEGGSLQIGNTTEIPGHSVRFNIETLSANGQFLVKTGGFLGFAVGIATKASNIPNDWRIDNLFNVQSVTVNIIDGLFAHDHIFPGSSSNAALFAIGEDSASAPLYSYIYEPLTTEQFARINDAGTHGGGNMVMLRQNFTGPLNPIVGTVDNQLVAGRMLVGTLASTNLLPVNPLANSVNGTALFNAIKTFNMRSNLDTRALGLSNIARGIQEFGKALEPARALFVFGPTNSNSGTIERMDVYDIQPSVLGLLPSAVIDEAIGMGAALVGVDNPADPIDSAFFQLIPR